MFDCDAPNRITRIENHRRLIQDRKPWGENGPWGDYAVLNVNRCAATPCSQSAHNSVSLVMPKQTLVQGGAGCGEIPNGETTKVKEQTRSPSRGRIALHA